METNEIKNDVVVTEETLAGKLAEAEKVIAQMAKEKEILAAERAKLQEPLKAELQKKIDALPESVKARFVGKEIDPVDGLKQVEQAAQEYKAIEAEAKAKVKAEIDAYRDKLQKAHGINIPDLDKVLIEATKTDDAKVKPTNSVTDNNNAVDLSKRDSVSLADVSKITSSFSQMSKWIQERKS